MDFKAMAAMAAVVLTIPVAAVAETTDAPVRATVRVRTFNYFGVSANDLQIARTHAEGILREAGIEVSWLDCAVDRDPCTQPLDGTDLMLRLGSADQASPSRRVSMGFSLVTSENGEAPRLATVHANRVTSVARGARIDMRALLGRVIAHEIGHLLLNTTQHASTGVMRAAWSRAELRRDAPGDWTFLVDEAGTMRTALAMRQAAR